MAAFAAEKVRGFIARHVTERWSVYGCIESEGEQVPVGSKALGYMTKRRAEDAALALYDTYGYSAMFHRATDPANAYLVTGGAVARPAVAYRALEPVHVG